MCENCGYTESEPSVGLNFTLNDDGESYSVSGIGVCTDLLIVIPSEYEGKPVTAIKNNAFYGWDVMTGVVIPSSVTKIGACAFYGCTKLEKINIPDTVTEIGEDAFYQTAFQSGEKNWVDGSLYIGKHLIKVERDVTGAYVIREGTKSIADSAFSSCSKILKVTIPDSVVAIGEKAFSGCSRLGQVTIGKAVRRIGSNAFYRCNSLNGVHISDLAGWCGTNFGSYEGNPLYYAKKLYLNNELITDLVIPEGVTRIGDYTFYGYESLTSFTIPNTVTSIGEYAFYDCDMLTMVTVGDGVTSIGYRAFGGCENLTSVTIPFIGEKADGTGSTRMIDVFGISGGWGSAYLPKSLATLVVNGGCIPDEAFEWCSSLTSVTLGDGVTSIGEEAFYYCSSLATVIIGDGVTGIGEKAFYNCSNLAAITYNGTFEQWNAISRDSRWNNNTGEYKIVCTDGEYNKYYLASTSTSVNLSSDNSFYQIIDIACTYSTVYWYSEDTDIVGCMWGTFENDISQLHLTGKSAGTAIVYIYCSDNGELADATELITLTVTVDDRDDDENTAPDIPTEEIELLYIHYYREDKAYDEWGFWIWEQNGNEGQLYAMEYSDEFGGLMICELSDIGEDVLTNGIGVIPRRLDDWVKDGEDDRLVQFSELIADENNCYHLYILEGDINIYSADMLK